MKGKINPYVFPGIKKEYLTNDKSFRRTKITPTEILKIVADYHLVTTEDIIRKCNKREVSDARHMYCAVLKNEFKYTYVSIGNILSGRDHTTVIHSLHTFKDRSRFEDGYKEHYLCGMKTLIIHPSDPSTTFLDIVYESIPNKTVITGGVSKDDVKKLIQEHDRVMMMGHGSPGGLFGVGQFTDPNSSTRWGASYIIDNTMVPLLAEKDNSVFIWCNADKFVDGFGLKGFYSGMFISEVGEASYCGLPGTPQDVVDESNYGFVNIIGKHINEDTESIYEKVRNEYGLIAEENPVALYNHKRLYKSI